MFWMALAWAGDPCPITVDFLEYTPSWRDRAADLAALKSKKELYGVTYKTRNKQVQVTRLVPHTQAATLLKVGDVIEAVQGAPVTSNKEVDAAWPDGPVTFTIQRDGTSRPITVPKSVMDPLVAGMFIHAKQQECRDVGFLPLTTEQAAAVAKGAFDDNRGFRCEDAHTAIKATFEPGSIVAIRGGHRVLFTMPGWTTTCVDVAATDGPALTEDVIGKTLEKLTAAYVKDRHDNP